MKRLIDDFKSKKIFYLPGLIAVVSFFLILYFFLSNLIQTKFIQDDAYTSLRYVKNIFEGNGLVFNAGERVEGYTNFLWVILLSLTQKLYLVLSNVIALDLSLDTLTQFYSIFFGILVLILTYFLSSALHKKNENEETFLEKVTGSLLKLAPVFLLAYSTPLIYWSVSGMETSLFVSLFLLALIYYLKGSDDKINFAFIIISILNSLLRPEGIIVFVLFFIHKIIFKYFENRRMGIQNKFSILFSRIKQIELLIYLTPLILYLILKWIYYGYPLPNTFYAKTEFSLQFLKRGYNYFWDFTKAYLVYGLLLIFPVLVFVRKNISFRLFLYIGSIISWIIIVIFIGGDVLPMHRFFLNIMPLCFILFTNSISTFIRKITASKKIARQIINLIFLSSIVLYGLTNYHYEKNGMLEKRAYEAGLVKKMKIYAGWVENQSKSLPSFSKSGKNYVVVAMSTIGAFSFYSDANVIDIVGLTNEYIAHHPKETPGIDEELPVLWKERNYNADFVMNQKPDYIIFPAGAKPSAFAECALFAHKDFINNYYAQLFYSEELHQMLPIFTRREAPNNSSDCSIKFLKPFINANNNLLRLTQTKDENILKLIFSECDSVINYCPTRKSDALTLKGISLYHIGKLLESEKLLREASLLDIYNSMSRIYLKNIYVKQGKINNALIITNEILKYSPDAIRFNLHK